MEYTVTWTIELDAESFEEAAYLALKTQRDPDSIATHFRVRNEHGKEQALWADSVHPRVFQEEETTTQTQKGGESMQRIYIGIALHQGILTETRAFESRFAAEKAEARWLSEQGIHDADTRQGKSDNGTEFHVIECHIET